MGSRAGISGPAPSARSSRPPDPAKRIVGGAAKAFGWIPGLGGKLEAAEAAIVEFRDGANAAIAGVREEVQYRIHTNLNDIHAQVAAANRIIAGVADRQVRIKMALSGAGIDTGVGKRAHGGPVLAARPYIVGEKGPELMVPNRSGMVIPNHQLGGGGMAMAGGGTVINIDVDARYATEGTADMIERRLATVGRNQGRALHARGTRR
jgi:hypothetical protein